MSLRNMKWADTKVTDYNSALRYYNAGKPWRGESGDERPFQHVRDRNKGVRTQRYAGVDAVLFRYYSTDVVTYYESGVIELDPYSSKTTDDFARMFLPGWIRPYFNTGTPRRGSNNCAIESGVVMVEDRYYRLSGRIVRIEADRTVSAGTHLWVKPLVDRKAANAMRRENNITAARDYLRAATVMGREPAPFSNWRANARTIGEVLRDTTRWAELHELGGMAAVDWFEQNHLKSECLVESVGEPFLRGWHEVETYRRAWWKWGEP